MHFNFFRVFEWSPFSNGLLGKYGGDLTFTKTCLEPIIPRIKA